MEIKKRSLTAWTPELGGEFSDLKLEITAFLMAARRKVYQKSIVAERVDGNTEIKINAGTILESNDQRLLDSITAWENFIFQDTGKPIPCNDETKAKYLADMMHLKTGIERPWPYPGFDVDEVMPEDMKKEFFNLGEFIDWFSGTIENYEKN